jgi:hypothetical protein
MSGAMFEPDERIGAPHLHLRPYIAEVCRAVGFHGVGLNITHLQKYSEKENIFQKVAPKKLNIL